MKTKFTTPKLIVASLFLAIAAISCNKGSNSVQTSDAVSENDAAQITTDAVMPNTGGVSNQSSTTAALFTALPPACGIMKDSTLSYASLTGATPVYAFTFTWMFQTVCGGNPIPSTVSANYSFTGKGSYAGTNITASHTGNGQFVLTNSTDSADYSLNGTYVRTGSFASRYVHPHSFTSVITVTATNVYVSKSTKEITGGSGTVTIAATTASGKNYNFAGKVTFLGNKKATLVLNSGVSYPIQWL